MGLSRSHGARTKPTVLPLNLKKQPRQSRAKFTVSVILEAAQQLLWEGGIKAVTTRHVAQRAGVGVGTLYEYFPNRDAILIQLANRSMRKRFQDAIPHFHESLDISLPELFRVATEYAVEVDRELLRFGHEFHARYARHFNLGNYYPLSNDRRRQQILDTVERSAAKMLSDRSDEVGAANTEMAAFLICRALRGMINTVVEERPELIHSPAFAATLQRIMLAIADYREPLPVKASPSV